ncbi:hypothetical protein PF005_g14925 [Phytophthora fragariae]|uniref:ABC transporter family G domain-containing protein n=1 Tax=Phytophthora fragariae TaxID=53985 RepID=A0A6A3S4Z3_9STRA|nr:hypothetical protein PF003_g23248 [Phytophthora fragariae]KAE8937796.1 hypothetical protein PF009_g12307 [Phytophthora fragariae]KAE9109063.1 hypothetical protein PF007_g12398 [Phytophthora fragariae]KAE9144234.1 hypothetical protein PF006_g10810 [Phytophthora fragariae]KAE9201520.1 hypothetical protein PF005_g14925 [Phytophthora fragariae]
MKFIVKLCAKGKTIVRTIHQTSSMFMNAIVLSAGQTVYCGPRRHMIPHFASPGHDCPQYTNPVKYFINLVNTDFEDHVDMPKLVQSYAQSEVLRKIAPTACGGM